MVLDDLGAEPGAAALMGSADPRVAAQARAQQRKKGKSKWGDTAFGGVEDVARAEEDFQGEEEEQEAMEPFNLQQEREEGYFDAEGNYVEYREDTEATSSRSSASSRSSHSDAESEDRGAGDERREGNGEREEEKEGGYDGEGLDGDVKGSGVEESTGRDPQGDAREGGEQGGMADGGTGLGVTLDFDEDDGSDYSESSDGEGGGSGSDRSGEEWQVNEGGEQEHASGVKRKERGAGEAAEGDERPAKRMEAGEGGAGGAEGEGLLVRVVADHYSRRDNQQRHEREASPIIHLKKLNNWIKSVLIRLHTHPARGARVLDLACGKGGDLTKWARVNVGFYLGVDVAEGSVHDAMARYNGDSHRSFAGGDGADSDRRQMRFPAKLACADCFGVALDRELLPWAPFDICSTQFALHYSFETEQRARCGLRNIAALLRPGGMFIGTIPDANVLVQKLRASPNLRFGNSVYSIEFAPEFADKKFPSTRPYGIRYEFRLEDAVDCPEWLVPFAFLQRLAGEYGLQALYHANFHTFIKTHAAVEPHASLLRRIAGERWREEMTADEWDAAYLYCVFVFRKEGQGGPEGGGAAGERREEVIRRMEIPPLPFPVAHATRAGMGDFPPHPRHRPRALSLLLAAPLLLLLPALACVSPPPPLASLLSSLSLALPALSACFSSPLPPPPPLLPIPTARQLTRQRAELAAFFHVGMNTFTDREWGTGREDPRLFNPAALNASQWVDTVKAAGFQLVVLTAKHHDGFCLWPSALTNHSVRRSPWKAGQGDVVADVAAAARAAGVGLGLYLSPWDRNARAYEEGSAAYNALYEGQLRELLTRYGPVAEVWLDGAKGDRRPMTYHTATWQALIRQLQPAAAVFSAQGPDLRWAGNERGEAGEACWGMVNGSQLTLEGWDTHYLNHGDVAGTDWMPAECDVSIRPGWFWHPSERPKPLARLLDLYFASVGRGCALLLNVPPNTTGLLHGEDVQRVGQFGRALQVLFQEDVSAGARVLASSVYGCEGGWRRKEEEERGLRREWFGMGLWGWWGGWVRGRGRCDYGPENVLSAGDATFWAAQDGVLSATLEFDLGQGKTFHVVRLEEPVAYGQRIKSFTVEVIDPDPAAAPAAAPAAPVAQVGGAGAGGCGPGGCNTEDGVLPSLPGVPSLGEPALHTSHGPQAAARSMLERTGSAGRAGEWRVVARGSTVGRKRLFRLEAVRAQHVRLVIHDARAAPLLSFFALYRSGDLSTI
ncbi:unnamed protein product [Closterium sp. Yama58-4]|nr:unnamed protein product [Closterium sp. Yama58-4]